MVERENGWMERGAREREREGGRGGRGERERERETDREKERETARERERERESGTAAPLHSCPGTPNPTPRAGLSSGENVYIREKVYVTFSLSLSSRPAPPYLPLHERENVMYSAMLYYSII